MNESSASIMEDFDFKNAEDLVMENIKKEEGDHWIWQKIEKDRNLTRVYIKGKRFTPNLLLIQCELKQLLPKCTVSKNTCDVKYCVNPEHWILKGSDEAEYKLAKIRLLKNCIVEDDCLL